MTLQSSGAISLGDIQTEFGGSNPISINEYYKNGTYVPESVETEGTASNMTYTNSSNAFWRYYDNGSGPLPNINNTGNYLFGYAYWTDAAYTSGTSWVDSTVTIDIAGSYKVTMSGYNPSPSATRTMEVFKNSVSIGTVSFNGELEFTAEAGDTIRIYSTMNTVGNFNQLYCRILTSNGNTTLSVDVNTNVPTSEVIQFDDFYDGKATY